MKNIKKLSEKDLATIAQILVNEGYENYHDYGCVIYAIAANIEYMLKYVPDCVLPEERNNLIYLRSILETSARMFFDIDDVDKNQ